jgi:hypothetical protein
MAQQGMRPRMIEALRKAIKRMHYPFDVMLTCVQW